MIKELLEDLMIEFDEMGYEPMTLCDTKKEIDSFRNRLKQVLDYLKAIDNSNPSEALKYVNGKIADLEDDLQHYTMVEKDKCKEFFIREDLKKFTTIKQALLKAQKMERVLEIIFEKNVTIFWLKECKNLEEYNYNTANHMKLTQEEFNSLKEVLKCQKD